MIIFVKTLSGACFQLTVERTDTIEKIKLMLGERGYNPSKIRLFSYNSAFLTDDDKSLEDYGVTDEDILRAVIGLEQDP